MGALALLLAGAARAEDGYRLTAQPVAREWAQQTWGTNPRVVDTPVRMMMGSREAVVDYTGALGLAHLMATGHHYGPGPWVDDLKRPEWNPVYYHKADRNGIGFDRTKTGSDAVSQYAPAIAKSLADPKDTPERELLWFHHVAWDRKMPSGKTLWEYLVSHYDRGVAYVGDMRRQWDGVRALVDDERWQKTATDLAIQEREARWWRDASLSYWMSVNGRALPVGVTPPEHDLAWYKAANYRYVPGHHD